MAHTARPFLTAIAALLLVAGFAVPAAAQTDGSVEEAPADVPGVLATYNGRIIDLSKGWEGAQACVALADGTAACYDTDGEARAAHDLPAPTDEQRAADPSDAAGRAGWSVQGSAAVGSIAAPIGPGGGTAAVMAGGSCSGSLILYSGQYHSGSTLYLGTATFYSLASFGFDQRARSWTNFSWCVSHFYDTLSGGVPYGYSGPWGAFTSDGNLTNNTWTTGGITDLDISYVLLT